MRVDPDGSATVVTGSVPGGQAHETVWAQIASSVLGLPFEQITVVHSDTEQVPHGVGTFGSRSLQLAGSAVHDAATAVLDEARQIVADRLEAAVDDIVVFDDGRLGVAGTPASGIDVGARSPAAATERDELARLAAEIDFDSDGTFPFGMSRRRRRGRHRDRRDPSRAARRCRRLRPRVINPMIAAGQVHGGIGQGVAQALFEGIVYDDDGNPLTASFLDYGIPSAAELPSFEVHHVVTRHAAQSARCEGDR